MKHLTYLLLAGLGLIPLQPLLAAPAQVRFRSGTAGRHTFSVRFWQGDFERTDARAFTTLGVLPKRKTMPFKPQTNVPGEDWVLMLDDAAKNYPPPEPQP